MAQYEPTRTPSAVAVGTDPDETHHTTPLTWGFKTRYDENTWSGDNVEGPHRERWGPSTSCPVRHWRRIRDSNS